jgi:hypothetical protein
MLGVLLYTQTAAAWVGCFLGIAAGQQHSFAAVWHFAGCVQQQALIANAR